MKDFKQLRIWQKGLEIAAKSFKLTQTFPGSEKFGLSAQITRAGVSIASNIAEGSSRKSEKEYAHFIEIALGSAFEMETQLLIAEAINYGQTNLRTELLKDLVEEQKMLAGFKKTLNNHARASG